MALGPRGLAWGSRDVQAIPCQRYARRPSGCSVLTCSACGAENPDGFKFCGQCGAALAAPLAHPDERKVVTTLFCDLVGFTAACERADPEDVDEMLRGYSRAARRAIESFGGTVEKFIGDAVVAVFGVPVVHEDDPERAVRAGMRLVELVAQLPQLCERPLQVRVGINTGEALVRLDVRPGSGEGFLAGDAVNVAARLQGAAPPMGVVAGELTRALTTKAIDYESLGPLALKGKTEPLEAWLALGPAARTGVRSRRATAPRSWVARPTWRPSTARSTKRSGKDRPPSSSWSASRAWQVAPASRVRGRVERAAAGHHVAPGPLPAVRRRRDLLGRRRHREGARRHPRERRRRVGREASSTWSCPTTRTVPGSGGASGNSWTSSTSPSSREESFAAWRRFLVHISTPRPTVLVIEDLHWADEAMLAFVDHLSVTAARCAGTGGRDHAPRAPHVARRAGPQTRPGRRTPRVRLSGSHPLTRRTPTV